MSETFPPSLEFSYKQTSALFNLSILWQHFYLSIFCDSIRIVESMSSSFWILVIQTRTLPISCCRDLNRIYWLVERRVVDYLAVCALSMNWRGGERKMHGEVISLPMLHVETRPFPTRRLWLHFIVRVWAWTRRRSRSRLSLWLWPILVQLQNIL